MHFKIHNGARDVETRVQRAAGPKHGGLKQFIMNGSRRLLRGRPVTVSEDQLKQYIEELAAKEAQGILYVTTVDERQVVPLAPALKALRERAQVEAPPAPEGTPVEPAPETKPEEPEVVLQPEPPVPVQNPTPNMPLDDANKDTPRGLPMNANANEAPPPDEFQMPVPTPHAAVETPAVAPLEDANAGTPAVPVDEPKAEEPKAEEPAAPAEEPAVEEPETTEEPAAEGDVPAGGETEPASPGGKKKKKGR